MEEFFVSLKLLLKVFNHSFLEETSIESDEIDRKGDIVFTFKIKGAVAHMKIVDNDYVILKGSTIVKGTQKYIPQGILDARETLELQDKLVGTSNPNLLELTVNYIWKSPSYSSAFVAGGNDNGKTSWKHNGKTLAEVEEEGGL